MGIDHGALVEVVSELVRIPSVFDPSTDRCEEPAARAVATHLRAFGWEPTTEHVAPGRPNVHCVVDGGLPGPTLMFEGHTDVVTEGDIALWSVDPFSATIDDGRLYGRGAADMKSGLVAAMFATRALADRGPFPGRIVIAALCDEEGMMTGAKHFVSVGHMTGVDGVICCEPEGGEICNTAKGALRIRVGFHGRMAHGAMPFMGANPNRAVGAFLVALADLESDVQAATGEHEHLGRAWLTPTVLRAGDSVQMNVMPADAAVWIDVRTIPGIDHGELVERLVALAASCAARHDVSAATEVIDDRPVIDVDPTDPLVQAVLAAHVATTGAPGVLGGVPGATDGTVLTSRTGVPSVVYGPGGKWIAHQADEFVEIADIVRHAEVYVEAADRFLRRAE
jgi:succinyl-diaminopimelate desuccinylase